MSYRLRAPLLALKRDDGERPNFRTLPPGVVITLTSEVRESGLVEVAYRESVYTVFYEDVQQRGEMAVSGLTEPAVVDVPLSMS